MMSDVFQRTQRTARKAHRCQELGCRSNIQPGQIYVLVHGVYEGSGFSHKMCWWCSTVNYLMTEWYQSKGIITYSEPDEWPQLGNLWHWLHDMAHDCLDPE